ncbi:MAG: response regulator transcription factor [Armatimonadota bacterium]
MITIVLADDHQVVRQGLRALLETQPDFEIVGETATGLQTLSVVRRLKPRVLVLDLMMPELSGVEVTRQVTKRYKSTAVIILSMYDSEAYVQEALRNGASGYVLKGSGTAELSAAIRAAADGKKYLCPQISEQTVEEYTQKSDGTPSDLYDTLSSREREVLQLSAEGCISSVIAERLEISARTVEVHRMNVTKKLKLKNHSDLVRYAVKRGIIPLEK